MKSKSNSNQYYINIVKKLMDNTLIAISNMVQHASYDKSFRAQITKKISNSKYEILYNKKTYTVSSDKILTVEQYVTVTALCNNWNNLWVR